MQANGSWVGAGRDQSGRFARGREQRGWMAGVEESLAARQVWEQENPAKAALADAEWRLGMALRCAQTEPARYRRPAGGELMRAAVKSFAGDLVIAFRAECGTQRQRFLLVTPGEDGQPRFWLHLPEKNQTFPHDGKYVGPAVTIMAERSHCAEILRAKQEEVEEACDRAEAAGWTEGDKYRH